MFIENHEILGEAETALLSLARNVELIEGKTFRTNKKQSVKNLLTYAQNCKQPDIRTHYEELCEKADSSLKELVETSNFHLDVKKVDKELEAYRSTSLLDELNEDLGESRHHHSADKYYRGTKIESADSQAAKSTLETNDKNYRILGGKDSNPEPVRLYRGQVVTTKH